MLTTFRTIMNSHFKIKNLHYQSQLSAHKCSKTQAVKGPPWRILFFGTDHFSLRSLKALCAKLRTGTLISSLGVVTKRHSVVCKFGEEEKLPLYFWPVDRTRVHSQYDIGMVVSFGDLINEDLINELPLGCINVHASLLPRWRGAAPIIHAILAGDNETGVTVMRIHPHKFDIGEIVRQYRISISQNETSEELERRLSALGSDVLMECLRDLPKCVQMAVPQPDHGITYAPKVYQKMSHIQWEDMTARSLFNLHRAISHLFFLKTNWNGLHIKLRNLYLEPKRQDSSAETCTESVDAQKSALDFLLDSPGKPSRSNSKLNAVGEAGKCFYDKDMKCLKVTCADGEKVIVNSVQVANKIMTATDFYNGYMTKKDPKEWKFSTISV